MPRPMKCRKVCRLPDSSCFSPVVEAALEPVVLSVDEYEAIRLIDREGFTQEQAAKCMQVARTTVQAIYTSARHKLAVSLTEARVLRISGGDITLCHGTEGTSGCGGCAHRRCRRTAKEDRQARGVVPNVTEEAT